VCSSKNNINSHHSAAAEVYTNFPDEKLVQQQEIIFTCESCGEVIHMKIECDEEIETILRSHHCKNNCKAEFRSYIIIGKLNLD